MPKFSKASLAALETCDHRIQKVLHEAIKYIDFTVLEGHRGKEAQDKAYASGNSKIKWPNGKHNKTPSLGVDIAPYPIDWKDTERFVYFAGFIMGLAVSMGITLRWGGDWNMNTRVDDETFRDWGHFEIP